MTKAKSLPFILGYLLARIEGAISEHFLQCGCNNKFTGGLLVPKTWFGLSSCPFITNDIKGDYKYQLKVALQKVLSDLYPNFETVCEKIIPEGQYIKFDFKITPLSEVKKMTVEEIEKELGYKIEIVSDK